MSDWLPSRQVDTRTPSTARIYDYLLGGKDHYAADREAAGKALEMIPTLRKLLRANRQFLVRAVRYCAEQGIDQFIDIGTGLPTAPNVPEVAREIQPNARVVGVDPDPIVLAHHRAMIAVASGISTIEGDVRHPHRIFADVERTGLIDLNRPVAVLLVAVMHFVRDSEDPAGIIRRLMQHNAPGSYLVLAAAALEGADPVAVDGVERIYDTASAPLTIRPTEQIRSWLEPWHLVEPGLVDVRKWRPDRRGQRFSEMMLGGVAYKTNWDNSYEKLG
ncbi:MAG: SAM-dependent methyltransferase [Streptomycetales bacterium]